MARKRREPSDHVRCKHCGEEYRAITAPHLRNRHGYEGDHPIYDYQRRFGLEFSTCRDSRKKIGEAKEQFWAKRGQHWTRATLLAEIRRLNRAGRSLRCGQVPVRLYEAARRLLGTWEAALGKAGLNYEVVCGIRRWNRKKIIEQIQGLAAAGVPLNATHIEKHYSALHRAALKHFPKSWDKALRAAGFDPNQHKMLRGRWDERKATGWVRKRVQKRQSILACDLPRDISDFVWKRLGKGWAEFVESLGIPYPGIKKKRDWTKAKLLSEIRQRKTGGHRLNYRAVADSQQELIHQARKFFGSWERARAAAGV